jgi:cytochrome c biogenesis factor
VLWSGQEGSHPVLVVCCLSAYAFVLRLRYKTDPRLFAYASVVLAGVQIFFLALLNFAAHPFAIVQGTIPADGNGLNPSAAVSRDGDSPAHAVSRLCRDSPCPSPSRWAR